MPLLGAHVSVAGGLPKAFDRAAETGCEALQIFVKSPNQWEGRALVESEVAAFREARRAAGNPPVIAHAAYLINLASADPAVLERSRAGLVDELERATRLGLDGLVLHPGAHLGDGVGRGLERVAESLDVVLEAARDPAPVLLETTAGQGTVLGWRLEQLEAIVARCRASVHLGICLDICHLFAAGYEVQTAAGLDAVLAEVARRFGGDRLGSIHVNDSRYPKGSRRDRHANLGEGEIGLDAFAHLARSPLPAALPLLLETPRGDDGARHRAELELLAEWRDGSRSRTC